MTQSQHTPGPWVIKTRTIETPNLPVKSYEKMGVFAASQTDQMTGDGVRIADLAYCCPTFTEIEANAHIIASAPDMLEALEALWGYARWCSETNNVPNFMQDDMGGRIQNVINKAKGGQ